MLELNQLTYVTYPYTPTSMGFGHYLIRLARLGGGMTYCIIRYMLYRP